MGNYKATVNEQFEFSDLSAEEVDVVRNSDGSYHLLRNGKAFRTYILHSDFQNKTITIKINGNRYVVRLEDQYDQLIKDLGLEANKILHIKEIHAPMPGLVLQILAEPGLEVEIGDPLLILEAMKMENVIKAPGAGKIESIEVRQGQAVDKGQILIRLA